VALIVNGISISLISRATFKMEQVCLVEIAKSLKKIFVKKDL